MTETVESRLAIWSAPRTAWAFDPYSYELRSWRVLKVGPASIRTDEGKTYGSWRRLDMPPVDALRDRQPLAVATRLYIDRRAFLFLSERDALEAAAASARARAERLRSDANGFDETAKDLERRLGEG